MISNFAEDIKRSKTVLGKVSGKHKVGSSGSFKTPETPSGDRTPGAGVSSTKPVPTLPDMTLPDAVSIPPGFQPQGNVTAPSAVKSMLEILNLDYNNDSVFANFLVEQYERLGVSRPDQMLLAQFQAYAVQQYSMSLLTQHGQVLQDAEKEKTEIKKALDKVTQDKKRLEEENRSLLEHNSDLEQKVTDLKTDNNRLRINKNYYLDKLNSFTSEAFEELKVKSPASAREQLLERQRKEQEGEIKVLKEALQRAGSSKLVGYNQPGFICYRCSNTVPKDADKFVINNGVIKTGDGDTFVAARLQTRSGGEKCNDVHTMTLPPRSQLPLNTIKMNPEDDDISFHPNPGRADRLENISAHNLTHHCSIAIAVEKSISGMTKKDEPGQ